MRHSLKYCGTAGSWASCHLQVVPAWRIGGCQFELARLDCPSKPAIRLWEQLQIPSQPKIPAIKQHVPPSLPITGSSRQQGATAPAWRPQPGFQVPHYRSCCFPSHSKPFHQWAGSRRVLNYMQVRPPSSGASSTSGACSRSNPISRRAHPSLSPILLVV